MPAQSFSGVAQTPSPAASAIFQLSSSCRPGSRKTLARPRGGPVPRIYVGNLAESVTRDALRALFAKIGRVGGALVITDKLTGKSRGFGFVEMIEVDDAINAAVFF